MRFLLIAYDFPPIPSPQSLRWAYLARELALAGHEVHVLAPDVDGYGNGGLPAMPPGVMVHRAWPGPVNGFITKRRRARRRGDMGQATASSGDVTAWTPATVNTVALNWKGRLRNRIETTLSPWFGPGLNWKGRVIEGVKAFMSLFLFPDVRAEWEPSARRLLDHLLETWQPETVISSHEPATTIALGLHAKRKGYVWVVDLGDPVVAPYTPRRWRKRAWAMERQLCAEADLVTVTSETARRVLRERHGIDESRCATLTQGFDHRATAASVKGVTFETDRLELLYTGSFYSFRKVGPLLEALLAVPAARLSVGSVAPPPDLVAAAHRHPDQIRLLGFIPHVLAVALQRQCDVLVNLANADPVQVPGKFYEYLGSGTPILNIGGTVDDAAADLLRRAGGGWCSTDDSMSLRALLGALAEEKSRAGQITRSPTQNYDPMQHSWERLSQRLVELILERRPDSAARAVPALSRDAVRPLC
jgi:glycosyltransferase involved in cell wall biosynthesis